MLGVICGEETAQVGAGGRGGKSHTTGGFFFFFRGENDVSFVAGWLLSIPVSPYNAVSVNVLWPWQWSYNSIAAVFVRMVAYLGHGRRCIAATVVFSGHSVNIHREAWYGVCCACVSSRSSLSLHA